MTMPKKGRRELTIGDTKYYYMVKSLGSKERSVVIQNANTLRSHTTTFRQSAVTPADVKQRIHESGI